MSIAVPLYGFGGGTDPLNFKVVNGYNTTPSNPKENTIWVNTGVEIISWVFSSTKPENPVQGMVWFNVGTGSNAAFNALKKNTIQVYPISASIYNNGEWSEKEVKIYQNGAWTTSEAKKVYLFNNGDQCTDITGGWSGNGYEVDDHACNTVYGIMSDNTWMYCTGKSGAHGGIGTINPVDLTKYKTLHFYGRSTHAVESSQVYIAQTKEVTSTPAAISMLPTADNWLVMDISGLVGNYYVFFGASANQKATSYCREIYLTE